MLTHHNPPPKVYEARVHGADTCLLIVAILSDARLCALMQCCRHLDMEPLVEVATPGEMQRALAAGARVIGINNRNLKDFSVDPNTTNSVIASAGRGMPAGTIVCALSGINTRLDVQRYRTAGCKAVLVGEALMRARDPVAKIAHLRGLPSPQPGGPPGAVVADDDAAGALQLRQSKGRLPLLVKICGLKRASDAVAAAAAGADLIGLVFAQGSSRCVSVEIARSIAEALRGMAAVPHRLTTSRRSRHQSDGSSSSSSSGGDGSGYDGGAEQLVEMCSHRPLVVGVFANQDTATVARIAQEVPLDVIQLSGTEGADAAGEFGSALVIKAVHISTDTTSADVAAAVSTVPASKRADAILLDTKRGSALGGTGVAFDHAIAADLGQAHSLPLFLAGGLTVENVGEKVREAAPFAVDVSSGVETNKEKDLDKIAAFIRAAKMAAIQQGR